MFDWLIINSDFIGVWKSLFLQFSLMEYRSKWLSRQYNIAISICLLFRKSCQHQRRSQRPEHATSHAKLQFREYQQERSGWRKAAASRPGAEIHCRPGSTVPIPVGLARIFSGWQRTSHRVVVVVAVVVSARWPRSASLARATHSTHRVVVVVAPGPVTSDKVPPAWPGSSGPVRAGQLPVPSCSRYYPRVRVCTCALTSAPTAHAPYCFYVLKHTEACFRKII